MAAIPTALYYFSLFLMVEIDARKWMASKLFKPTWGDKVAVDLSGGIAVAASIDVTGLTDEQVRVLASIPAQPK